VSAFPTEEEACLVDALRRGGKVEVSLVALIVERIVGHVLFSPVSIDAPGARAREVGLAPVAVRPEHQRRGIGAELIRAGLEECRRKGFDFVVVLGEPRYYRRFGFERAASAGLSNEYGVDEEFMVVERMRREITPGLYERIRNEWKAHSMAEDRRDIAGLLANRLPLRPARRPIRQRNQPIARKRADYHVPPPTPALPTL
jgi:putative acetyltransferase